MAASKRLPDPKLPERMADSCLSFRVRLLNRTLSRIYDGALRPFELTSAQLHVLLAVAAFGPAGPSQIAAGIAMEKSTLSRNLTRLVRRGLISAEPSGRGGSSRILRATEECLDLLAEVEPAWHQAQAQAREVLGAPGADAVADTADRIWNRPNPTADASPVSAG